MDCNKEEALRAKDIAEQKMERKDFTGARKFALKAQQLNPDLENLAQMLVVCDVHCSSEQKLFGNEMDWYGILQIEQTANDATIKKQYRKFALQLHPDKNNFAGAEAAFKLIGEAQRVLLDKEKRSQHDMKRRVQVNKTSVSRHNQQTTHTNSSSGAKVNVRRNVTNLNSHKQQSRQSAQERPNGCTTFWTICPFCFVKYQYYIEILNKSLRCQNCNRPFIALDAGKQQQHTYPANSSSQPAFSQQKDDLNHGAFKAGVRFQGNLHAEKSSTECYEKKGPTDVSGRTNGKRKQAEESHGSFGSTGNIHSEDNNDVFLRPSKRFQVNSTSKARNHPNVFLYVHAQFSDFDMDKRKECFVAGQIWAIYDTTDGMPRFYALIRKVLSPGFKLQITWLEPHPDDDSELNWVNEDLPVACGKYKLGYTDVTEDHLMFSHLVLFEMIGRNTFKVYPRKGETWALFKNWDIKWYMNRESHQQYEFEFVEVLSDYVDGVGVFVAYLFKLKGFVSLFCQSTKENNSSFQIRPTELFRFSHRVPSFELNGQERVSARIGSYELDPASLPMNIEEIVVPENLDVKKFGQHSTCGGEKTIYLNRSKPLKPSLGDGFTSKFNLEGSNLAEENNDSINPHASLGGTSEATEIPGTQFFDFESARSLEKFHVGQIWAFYSDEDGLPRYYGQISRIRTSPDVELHVTWLTCCWLPENTIRWEVEDMPIPCGRFKVNRRVECAAVYSNSYSASHQVHAGPVGSKSKHFAIFPGKGEVWAVYRNWSSEMKCSDLKSCEYDIVEVLGGNDLGIEVLFLELAGGFGSVFQGRADDDGSIVNLRIPRKELLRFSHQIPAFKLTEEHGNLRGFWNVDPGALPCHFGSK